MSKDGELRRSVRQMAAPEKVRDSNEVDLDSAHRADAARRASLLGLRRAGAVQQKAADGGAVTSVESVHAAAERGIASPTTIMPHVDKIQRAFGPEHPVSGIQAHVGGDSAAAMGATAFATGNHVVFDRSPDLHTAAHEAAHVIQQRQGVQLYGGVGSAGDAYEQHADAVADRVVAGESAADLLGASTSHGGATAVQRQAAPRLADASVDERRDQIVATRDAGSEAIAAAMRLAAKELDLAAETIETTVKSPPGPAGMDRQLRTIEKALDHARDTVHRLSLELSVSQKNKLLEGQAFERNLFILEGAYTRLDNAVVKAKEYAARDPHQPVVLEMQSIEGDIKGMFRDRGITPSELAVKVARMVGPHASDPRKEPVDQLRRHAIAETIEAVQHTARMIRMRMTTVDDEELGRNASLLALQMQELATCLEPADRKGMKPHTAALQKVLHEVIQLREEMAARPLLVARLGDGTPFAVTFRQIRQKAQRG